MILLIIIIILILYYFLNKYLGNCIENYQSYMNPEMRDYLNNNQYIIDENNKIVKKCNTCPSYCYKNQFNTDQGLKLAKDKYRTLVLLQENNIPVPNFMLVTEQMYNSMDISDIITLLQTKNITFPVVCKQLYGSFGVDVYVNITTKNNLNDKLKFLIDKYNLCQIENYHKGNVYRVLIIRNKVVDVICRQKPYIIGNGMASLQTLIEQRNNKLRDMGRPVTRDIDEIYIMEQGYSLLQVPPLNKKIYLTNTINYHNGADVSLVDINKIPQENIDMFIKCNNVIKLVSNGLDYVSPNIYVPYYKNNSVVIEVNSNPDHEIHKVLRNNNEINKLYENINNIIFN